MSSKRLSPARFARLTLPIVLALALAPFVAQADGLAAGQAAPEIGLSDFKGKAIKVAELQGKVVLVDFWASWCKPCKEELPVLEELHKKFADQGLVIVGVNIDKEASIATEFLSKNKLNLSFSIVNDKEHGVAKRYAPPTMPSSYLIDRSGKIRFVHEGFRASDGAKLEAEIKAMLN